MASEESRRIAREAHKSVFDRHFPDLEFPDEPDDRLQDDEMLCETCWGEGAGEECELEMDWVNYGRSWVLCPDCRGTGRHA
jgi:hypothetical protein